MIRIDLARRAFVVDWPPIAGNYAYFRCAWWQYFRWTPACCPRLSSSHR